MHNVQSEYIIFDESWQCKGIWILW